VGLEADWLNGMGHITPEPSSSLTDEDKALYRYLMETQKDKSLSDLLAVKGVTPTDAR
jgi:hypothetical protein